MGFLSFCFSALGTVKNSKEAIWYSCTISKDFGKIDSLVIYWLSGYAGVDADDVFVDETSRPRTEHSSKR